MLQLQGLANDVGAQGNAQITERLTEQLSACGFNITVSSALTAARTLVPALAAAAAAAVLLLSA